MTIRIVDVLIEIDIDQAEDSGIDHFTLEETGTLARELLDDALECDDGDKDLAHFELLTGPKEGRRFHLPDELADGSIGTDAECIVELSNPSIPAEVATVSNRAGGFVVSPTTDRHLHHNGEAVDDEIVLEDGDVLEIEGTRLAFTDPLESQLLALEDIDLDDPNYETASDTGALSGAMKNDAPTNSQRGFTSTEKPGPAAPENSVGQDEVAGKEKTASAEEDSKTPSGWGVIDAVLLALTVFCILSVILILGVTFELI